MSNGKYRERMSTWDFSNHTHTVEEFKSESGNTIRVDHMRKGNSSMGYVRFVNDDYGLSVFGDFGNWIFCRAFTPDKDGYVCVSYWNEKLHMKSTQDHSKFDGDETFKELQEEIDNGLSEYGYDGEELKAVKEFYKELQGYTGDEVEYTYHAFRGGAMPDNIDYEQIPFVKKGSDRLLIVFDAFNEICNRLDKQL